MEDVNSDHIPCGANYACRGGSQQPSLLNKGETHHGALNPELAGSDLAGSDLAGSGLAGLGLAGSDLAGLGLAGSDLVGSDLAGSGPAPAPWLLHLRLDSLPRPLSPRPPNGKRSLSKVIFPFEK